MDLHSATNLWSTIMILSLACGFSVLVLSFSSEMGLFCSSCINYKRFLSMHYAGPFNFEAANESGGLPKLHLNPYSWSKVD